MIFRVKHKNWNTLSNFKAFQVFFADLFQFASADDAFGFGTNADKDLVLADTGNYTSPDFALTRKIDITLLG